MLGIEGENINVWNAIWHSPANPLIVRLAKGHRIYPLNPDYVICDNALYNEAYKRCRFTGCCYYRSDFSRLLS